MTRSWDREAEGGALAAGLLKARAKRERVGREGLADDVEDPGEIRQRRRKIEALDRVDEAMGRQDHETRIVQVGEVDHAEARLITETAGLELVAEAAHRLVAVMPVGDVDRTIAEQRDHGVDRLRIRDPEEAMADTVEVRVEHGLAERAADRLLPATLGIREEAEDQLQVGLTGAHQLQPILLRAGERALMWEHRSCAEAGQLDQRDEPLASVALPL